MTEEKKPAEVPVVAGPVVSQAGWVIADAAKVPVPEADAPIALSQVPPTAAKK